ncbi:hypothetical protein PG994_004622 [Apiospora phragmitis]|uniref:RRM domain-containing protein n=1 Tax=Apiospora phragmitis TaxID=2905665 RepID=A0ABR1VR47_9PEZI
MYGYLAVYLLLQNKRLNPLAKDFLPLGLDRGTSLKINVSIEPELQVNTRTPRVVKKEEEHVNKDHGMIKIGRLPKSNSTSFLAFCPDANAHITGIPESQSVNLFLRGLPADYTPRKLLNAIRGYGRIWSVTIHPPSPWHDHQDSPSSGIAHGPTASATLSFFEVAAARRFFEDTKLKGFLCVDGHHHLIRAQYHPRRLAGKEHLGVEASRCVLVEGDPDLVNEASLLVLLRGRLLFLDGLSLAQIKEDVVEVRHRAVTARRNVLELRFHGGFYGRAGLAADVLRLEDNPQICSVRYGEDPCASR